MSDAATRRAPPDRRPIPRVAVRVDEQGAPDDDAAAQLAVARALHAEMDWLSATIDARIRHYFAADGSSFAIPPAPPLDAPSRYGALLERLDATRDERLTLALALAPHLAPHLLDVFFLRNQQTDRGVTEFGGLRGVQHAGFLPTLETARFLLAGDDMAERLRMDRVFDADRPLRSHGVLIPNDPVPGEPAGSAALSVAPEFVRHLTHGEQPRPDLGPGFPARLVTTRLDWSDLVLDPGAMAEVETIAAWARHHRVLLDEWGLGRHIGAGFTALFYGPPGTGKTLTASLLGRELDADVYRVDLSQLVSKYIGETEKNLSRVFTEAERRGWLLFFDEADALFGKRTSTSNAHDRYANQEVSYLLQRVEEHRGIVVLASNFRGNIDDAFARRFQVIVHFAAPDAAQRERLWRAMLGSRVQLASDVDITALANAHELTGGQIVNVVRHACLAAVRGAQGAVTTADLVRAIRREQRKEGRST